MPKKRQTPVFLKVYLDKDKKETFSPYRMEAVENPDGTKVNSIVPNIRAEDESGNPKFVPVNRAARRALPEYREKRKLIRS